MKLRPPFWTSVSTLLSTRYHCGRSQIAEKFVSAQWKEEVKWSSTVTAQVGSALPLLQDDIRPLVKSVQL